MANIPSLSDKYACRRKTKFKAKGMREKSQTSHIKVSTEGKANVLDFGSVAAKQIDIINVNKGKNSLIMLHKVVETKISY